MQQYCAEELSNHILYADNHVLAINKPGGMLTQASGQLELNIEDWAREWIRVEKNKPGAVFTCCASIRSSGQRCGFICANQ